MNVIEAMQQVLLDFSGITGIGIDFTADADRSFGLSSTGDRLVRKTVCGKETRQHTFTLYAVFQSVNDYDRLANSGLLLELAQYIESCRDIPIEQNGMTGKAESFSTANGMLYEIPNGSIATAWRYQLQITINYYLESEDILK